MKSLFLAFTILFATLSAKAANPSLSQLLSLYYDVKNALVNSDATAAATRATEFVKAITNVDNSALSAEEQKAFTSVKEKLTTDATAIAKLTDINAQRERFKTFSDNFYTLAKAVKLSDASIYQQYCPMKKSYWLSNEATIKNPYYGKQMLTCGKVTETLR